MACSETQSLPSQTLACEQRPHTNTEHLNQSLIGRIGGTQCTADHRVTNITHPQRSLEGDLRARDRRNRPTKEGSIKKEKKRDKDDEEHACRLASVPTTHMSVMKLENTIDEHHLAKMHEGWMGGWMIPDIAVDILGSHRILRLPS